MSIIMQGIRGIAGLSMAEIWAGLLGTFVLISVVSALYSKGE